MLTEPEWKERIEELIKIDESEADNFFRFYFRCKKHYRAFLNIDTPKYSIKNKFK